MSHEITRFGENAEPLLAAGRGQGAEFRLHVLMELLPSLTRRSGHGSSDAAAEAGGRTGTSYGWSGRLLLSYLRVAKAVLSLVGRIQERPELAKWIKLRYGSRTIPWEDYFFDFGEYAALHKHLASQSVYANKSLTAAGFVPRAGVRGWRSWQSRCAQQRGRARGHRRC